LVLTFLNESTPVANKDCPELLSYLSMMAVLGLPPGAESFLLPHYFTTAGSQSSLFLEEASGPKAAGRRRQSPRSSVSSSAGPKGERRPRQCPQEKAAAFDGKAMAAVQDPNEQAPPLDLEKAILGKTIRCMTPDISME
jgi:hypothetical protein